MAKRGAKRRVGRARGLSAEQERRIKLTRGLSDEGLRSMPDDALRRALGRLNADNPARARQAFRQQQERDGRGRVPTNALMGALAQLDSLRVRSTSRRHLAGVPAGATANLGVPRMAAAGLSPSQAGWTALGPGNIGGRTRAIVIHPGNPS